jgi:hypothetical protein
MGFGLISAQHNPNHIQVSQAPVLHHHTRLTSRSHILHQDPNRRPAPRTPSLSAAAPSKGQSAGRCQTAKGVQHPRWRHDQPHGETRRRMGSRRQSYRTTFAVTVWSASFAGDGNSIAKRRSSGNAKETRTHPHPFRRPVHPGLAPAKAPGYSARRWRRVHALHRHANRAFDPAIHIPHRRVST